MLFSTQKETLVLLQNHLEGKIPESIYNLQSLAQINLGYNYLSGTLSTNIAQLFSSSNEFKKFKVANNSLTGRIPDNIFINSNNSTVLKLEEFDVSENKLYGTFPENIGDLPRISKLKVLIFVSINACVVSP